MCNNCSSLSYYLCQWDKQSHVLRSSHPGSEHSVKGFYKVVFSLSLHLHYHRHHFLCSLSLEPVACVIYLYSLNGSDLFLLLKLLPSVQGLSCNTSYYTMHWEDNSIISALTGLVLCPYNPARAFRRITNNTLWPQRRKSSQFSIITKNSGAP